MPCNVTIIKDGKVIKRDEMSDQAFIAGLESGWRLGGAIQSKNRKGHFYLIQKMVAPRFNGNGDGCIQTVPGEIILEQHKFN